MITVRLPAMLRQAGRPDEVKVDTPVRTVGELVVPSTRGIRAWRGTG
jgi:hypothetical protein